MLLAIVACEVGFWVLLGVGLLLRYPLRRPRPGAVLLVCVPLVDLVLLVLTVVDLRGGAPAEPAHRLAAVYLGFSVAFGHRMIRAADVAVAHRFAGGPAPRPRPSPGTWARVAREWQGFGRGVLAAGLAAVLLLGAVALVGPAADPAPLLAWLPRLGEVLLVWLVGWPLWQTGRTLARPAARPAER